MRPLKSVLAAGVAATALALAGCATGQQPGVSDQDHQAHHPDGAAQAAPTAAQKAPQQGGPGQGAMGMGMMGQGQGMMGGQGQGMMGGQGQGMMGQGMMGGAQGAQGMMDICPMMSGSRSPEDHNAMLQQRLKNMPPEQVKQMMSMMEKQMSMMQGDMQMMRDHLARQAQ